METACMPLAGAFLQGFDMGNSLHPHRPGNQILYRRGNLFPSY